MNKLIWLSSVLFISVTFLSCAGKQDNSGKKVSAEAVKIAPLFKADKFEDMPYRYFEPSLTDGSKYPVILYLHSEREAGTDNENQLITTECATIWVEPDHISKNPTYVIAPQIPEGADWTAEPAYSNTLSLLNSFIESHPQIDKNRIYIVGFSDGATGVWNMILKNPIMFAAAMPISGNAGKWIGDYDAWAALKNMPVIVIHSYDDPVVPVSASLNAVSALRNGGNNFVNPGSPNPSLWGPASVTSPHDAWYPAFHKYEVLYNSLFEQSLERTNNGEISPVTLYTKKELGNGVIRVWDYALGTAYVIERSDKAIIIDATMGQGNLYDFIKENVLVNKEVDIEIIITHNHNDHTAALAGFVGVPQLKTVYVNEAESELTKKFLGPDAGKIKYINEGSQIILGGKNIELVEVPGHSIASTVIIYEDNVFTGDAVGSNNVWMNGPVSVEQYIQSLQHLLDKMGNKKYTILVGHTGELRTPLTEEYIHQVMSAARGLLAGSIESVPYWRTIGGQPSSRKAATLGSATVVHDINNIHLIRGALKSLKISEGSISPVFAPFTEFYTSSVDKKVKTIDIIAAVLATDYKSLTINDKTVVSGSTFKATLAEGKNRFSIVVTTTDNTKKVYTLTITRGI